MRLSRQRRGERGLGSGDWRGFAIVAAGMAVTIAAAFGFGLLSRVDPMAALRLEASGFAAGLLAALPLVFLLEWFMRARDPRCVAFREAQIGFFAGIGFEFTALRIAILSLGAGVSEELLFRGVFQVFAERHVPIALAIALPNILFGALHWRTPLTAAIAGLAGVYFGALFWRNGNLLAPIVAHAAYDAFALFRARRAIADRKAAEERKRMSAAADLQPRSEGSSSSRVTG